jgi:hypothetical protein
MVNSREGSGSGASLSYVVLELLSDFLLALLPGAARFYRSDRDGPIRQVVVSATRPERRIP